MKHIHATIISFSMMSSVYAVDPNWNDARWGRFLDAVRQVETGGMANDGRGAVGDGGDAIGPYQIHRAYFIDAVAYDKSLSTHKYEECLNNKELSERVVKAYIKRYLPKGADENAAARQHNGGPQGFKRNSTLGYLKKFLKYWRND